MRLPDLLITLGRLPTHVFPAIFLPAVPFLETGFVQIEPLRKKYHRVGIDLLGAYCAEVGIEYWGRERWCRLGMTGGGAGMERDAAEGAGHGVWLEVGVECNKSRAIRV
jgi:hypothetical protein